MNENENWFDDFADGEGVDRPAEASSDARVPAPATLSVVGNRAKPEEKIHRSPWGHFTYWRRSRPFWGCLILALGGYLIVAPVVTSMSMIVGLGVKGITVWMLGGGMIMVAIVTLFLPSQRHFPAIMGIFFSVASLPLANLGGWILGMTLGIIGSGLIFAWTPYTRDQLVTFEERDRARDERKALRAAKRVA